MAERECKTEIGGPCPITGLVDWRCAECLVGGISPGHKAVEKAQWREAVKKWRKVNDIERGLGECEEGTVPGIW